MKSFAIITVLFAAFADAKLRGAYNNLQAFSSRKLAMEDGAGGMGAGKVATDVATDGTPAGGMSGRMSGAMGGMGGDKVTTTDIVQSVAGGMGGMGGFSMRMSGSGMMSAGMMMTVEVEVSDMGGMQ